MKVVFDTSVVLAILNEEKGSEVGENHMGQALLSVVNLAEVVTVLARRSNESSIRTQIRPFEKKVTPYDQPLALQTGLLIPYTKDYGLSLGDRACLATAMAHKLPVLTADLVWQKLGDVLDVEAQVIR